MHHHPHQGWQKAGPLTCAHKIQKHFLVPTMEFSPNLAGGLDLLVGRPSRSGAKNPPLSFQLRGQQGRSEGRDGQRERVEAWCERTKIALLPPRPGLPRLTTPPGTHPLPPSEAAQPQQHRRPSTGASATAPSPPSPPRSARTRAWPVQKDSRYSEFSFISNRVSR